MTECPVVSAIREIRGGGIYTDDVESNTNRMIKLGGTESDVDIIFDDVSFYIMSRKMELARFELTKPSLAACKLKYHTMFGDIINITYSELYIMLIDKALKKKYIYSQFVKLVDLLGSIEELIIAKVDDMSRKNQPINVSLPDITFLPHVDQLIIYRPDVLTVTMNNIIKYVNTIGINSMLKNPLHCDISLIADFAGNTLDTAIIVKNSTPNNVQEYIIDMKRILAQEIEVAVYVREIESYHCDVINHVNNVFDYCKKIIDELTV